jgi:hypothetical protein
MKTGIVTANANLKKMDVAVQAEMLRMLLAATEVDAIGAACSFLLFMSEANPEVFRRVMNEPVVKEGFRGVSLLETFNRVCR